jgi:transposase
MDERLRFVARLLDGEKMSVLCREFGISRKTGYKIFNRYKDFGLKGLEDRARTPHRHPNKLPFQVETAILRIKREHMSWGAPKIREKLIKLYPGIKAPAASTIHAVLDRRGLVKRRKRRRHKAQGTNLTHEKESIPLLWVVASHLVNAYIESDLSYRHPPEATPSAIRPGESENCWGGVLILRSENGKESDVHNTNKEATRRPPQFPDSILGMRR